MTSGHLKPSLCQVIFICFCCASFHSSLTHSSLPGNVYTSYTSLQECKGLILNLLHHQISWKLSNLPFTKSEHWLLSVTSSVSAAPYLRPFTAHRAHTHHYWQYGEYLLKNISDWLIDCRATMEGSASVSQMRFLLVNEYWINNMRRELLGKDWKVMSWGWGSVTTVCVGVCLVPT